MASVFLQPTALTVFIALICLNVSTQPGNALVQSSREAVVDEYIQSAKEAVVYEYIQSAKEAILCADGVDCLQDEPIIKKPSKEPLLGMIGELAVVELLRGTVHKHIVACYHNVRELPGDVFSTALTSTIDFLAESNAHVTCCFVKAYLIATGGIPVCSAVVQEKTGDMHTLCSMAAALGHGKSVVKTIDNEAIVWC